MAGSTGVKVTKKHAQRLALGCALLGVASFASELSAGHAELLPSAAADVPALALVLDCPTRAGKGRVVCSLDVQVRPGHVLRWADALVVSAPDFAPPLRSRVLATVPEEGATRATIAIPLFAKGENTGVLRVTSRAVVCPESDRGACVPETRSIEASVAVTREAGERPTPKLQ